MVFQSRQILNLTAEILYIFKQTKHNFPKLALSQQPNWSNTVFSIHNNMIFIIS